MAIRRPLTSASACIFVLRPPRERPTACFCSPLSTRCRAVRFHVRGVDHLRVGGSSVPSKFPEQVFPDAAPRPAHKAVIDRCRRTIVGRAIAPATAALQHVHDAANDAAIVHPLDAPDISSKTNRDRIVRAEELMSSDPSQPRLISNSCRLRARDTLMTKPKYIEGKIKRLTRELNEIDQYFYSEADSDGRANYAFMLERKRDDIVRSVVLQLHTAIEDLLNGYLISNVLQISNPTNRTRKLSTARGKALHKMLYGSGSLGFGLTLSFALSLGL